MDSSYFELFRRRYEIRVEQDVFACSFHVHDDSSTASQTPCLKGFSSTCESWNKLSFTIIKKTLGSSDLRPETLV